MLTTFPTLATRVADVVSTWTDGESAPVTDLNQFLFEIFNTLQKPTGICDMIGMVRLAASIRTFNRPLCALWTVTASHYNESRVRDRLDAMLKASDNGESVPAAVLANLRLQDEGFNLINTHSWSDLHKLIQIMHLRCHSRH